MDVQLVVVANALAVSVGVFFTKLWINGVNMRIGNIETKLEDKVSDKLCCERRKGPKEDIDELYKRIRDHELGRGYGQDAK